MPISTDECIKRINLSDAKVIFFLGAGCSVSSGLPGANELALKWLNEIGETNDKAFVENKDKFYENPGDNYQTIFDIRYKGASDKRKSMAKYIDGSTPGAGYAALAKYVKNKIKDKKKKIPMLLTVNFDDLVEQAMIIHAKISPQVISEESQAIFISDDFFPIIKLHGDFRFSPMNGDSVAYKLPEKIKESVKPMLNGTNIIILGYGGHENTISDFFEYMLSANINAIYWVNTEDPGLETRDIFARYGDSFIKVCDNDNPNYVDFDEFMIKLNAQHVNSYNTQSKDKNIPNIYYTEQHIEKHHKFLLDYHGYYSEDYKGKLNIQSPDYIQYFIRASEFLQNKNYNEAYEILKKAYEDYKKLPAFLSAYAHFIKDFGSNIFTESENPTREALSSSRKILEECIDLDKNNFQALSGLALVLKEQLTFCDDKDKAELINDIEIIFTDAENSEPNDYNNRLNHAGFLLSLGDKKRINAIDKLKTCFPYLFRPQNLLEYYFYSFGHRIGDEKNNLNQIIALLTKGKVSKNFDLSLNVMRIEKECQGMSRFDKFIKIVKLLADLICNKEQYNKANKSIIKEYYDGLQ